VLALMLLVIGVPTVALTVGLLTASRTDSELLVIAVAGALLSGYLGYAVVRNVQRLRRGA
jgi:zinc protease